MEFNNFIDDENLERVKVLTLIVIQPPALSAVVLQPESEQANPGGKSRVVPIWVGPVEARALRSALDTLRYTRPTTHDLLLETLTSLDAFVDYVVIRDVKGSTFYADLVLNQHGRLICIDSRPSDALTLAIRQHASIFMAKPVLESSSFPYIFKNPKHMEEEIDEFRDFLKDLNPEDFTDNNA
ncbi:MAG: bifunctional nuclease family protein [Eggerthellaceae bacterium]